MIRTLLYFLLAIIPTSVLVQLPASESNTCVKNYILESSVVPKPNQPTADVIISWDFSNTTNKEKLEVALNVQPLSSCWKGLEGKKRTGIRTFKLLHSAENIIGNQKIEFKDLNAKCFRWQAVIIDTKTNCETKTEWQFNSFL